ncbi:MAG: DUF1972 domain-containing protein [Bacilli bacterium]|nr:DUF1972 domain-containing protein [Bacilli bacterium]
MRNIFIVGARGYHANYGGWETFVSNLVDYYGDKETRFYVGELSSDSQRDKIMEKLDDNLFLSPIYVKTKSSPKMFFYAMKSYVYVLKYIKDNNLRDCYIYVLGLKLGPLLWFNKMLRRKYNVKIMVNPDGLEHRRSKWNKVVQVCFLLSEWSMLNHCDKVICDGLGIQKYVEEKYKKLKGKTTYIAYGARKVDFTEIDESAILKEYKLKKDGYCLMVGRCVPENNYELVIREFMNSKVKKDLIIISNLSSSNYYQELVNVTGCDKDKRIKFINGVYNQDKLAVIRKNAYLYIHGHSVGGTNPSLIEAISLTDLNILYDVCYNRDIGGDTCLYFKDKGSLVTLLNNKKLLDSSKKTLGSEAKKLYENNFTWEKIVDQYKQVFK